MKKAISVVLVILTMLSVCSAAMPVFAQEIAFSDDDYINEIIETEEDAILSEDLSKREENVKHFIMSDGSFIAAQYDTPIHYLNSEGEWVEYDNSLSEIEATEEQADLFGETELYTTGNETKNVVFAPKSNSNTLVAYEAKNYPISLNYQSTKKSYIKVDKKELNLKGNDAYLTLPNISQEVIYEDVFNDVDLQYIVTPSELKENIILKSNEAENEFTVNYNIGELTAEIVDSQTINLKNNDDVIIYTISAPYMYDSNGVVSEDVTLTVDKNKNGKLRVNISADREWLQNEERVYPVVIDPTIETETTKEAIDSVFVAKNSSYANTNFVDRREMLVGRETSAYGYCNSLFKFALPTLKKGDMVVAADLNVYYYAYDRYTSTINSMQVNAHMLKGSWDKSTVTWNKCPTIESTVLDYQIFTTTLGWMAFDISSAVKQWYEGDAVNNGILLKGADESSGMAVNGFKAALWTERYNTQTGMYPYITITYRNNKGLEDYWTYTTLSAGTAGTAYINDYTGNLVFIHGDVATTGELMPVSLEHVYNGYVAGTNANTYPHSGQGNKLSLQQTVRASSYYGLTGNALDIFPYAYEDGDGTVHFFYKETKDGVTKYLDEDGLNLELKVTSSGYTITDKSDNVMTFDSQGYLKTIADAEGRQATLQYRDGVNTANKTYPFLYKITDGAGHTITLDYNTGNGLTNGNNQLKSITGPDDKTITYETSGGCVTKITYPDGTYSSYTYNEDKTLATAKSSDGYKLSFTYTNDGSKRVTSVTEYGGSAEGQRIEFERKKLNQTVIRTAGKDAVFGNDDDIKTTYQFDNFGRTISTKMKLVGGTSLGAEKYSYTSGQSSDATDIGKRNRVSSSAASGKNATNFLVNHSLENSGSWTSLYWMNSGYTQTDNTGALSSEAAYLGSKSIKLNVGTTASANGGYSMYQNVSLTKGATYTLSGYIKTSGVTLRSGATKGGACLAVRFATESGTVREMSNMLDGTTDTAIDSGWQRISYTFKVPSDATSSRILAVLHNATGTAYFDCFQLEKSDTANSYNLLENASFENEDTSWTAASSLTTDDGIVSTQNNGGSYSYKIKGAASADKYIRQTVNVSGSEKDTYILSGYAKANSIPLDSESGKRFDISVKVTYTDGSSVIKRPLEFNDDVTAWQYSSGAFTLSDNDPEIEKVPQSITVYCGYRKQENTCYFDDISLIKEPSPTYSYDDDGNLVSATENAAKSSALSYDSNDNLESFTDEKNSQYTYKYATSGNKHRLLSAKSNTSGITYAYSYYDNGTLKAQEIKNSSTSKIIRTGYTYTEADSSKGISAGAYVKKERDQHKHDTTYTYDLLSGRVESVEDANGNTTSYTYNAYNGLVESVSSGGKTVNYAYNNAGTQLTSITHNGFNYNFVYDVFGNVEETKVGEARLMKNHYQDKNGNLTKSEYGNGYTVEYDYNAYGQTTQIKKDNQVKYLWTYNSTGMPYQHTDLENDRIYTYDYDSLGRVVRQFGNTKSTGENRFMSQYTYDVSNNVTKVVNFADGNKVTTRHTYDDENRPTKTTINSNVNYTYTYDELGRLKNYYLNLGATKLLIEPEYYASERNTDNKDTYQTTQIHLEKIGDRGYAYTYDDVGNIKTINKVVNKVDSGNLIVSYTYDDLGQLESEINVDLGQKIIYTYDNGGNITSKSIYAYTNGTVGALQKTINYTYDSLWKDKLTGYTVTIDGETPQSVSISYDEIGNPLTYRNGMSFTWNGRQMATANLNGTAVTYKYDADGLRNYKKVGNTVHEYEYVGGQLVYEKRGDLKFYYRYNALGELASIKRINSSGTEYTVYVVTNTRGDIEELRLASGTMVARYVYDTWGNTIGILDANGNQITDTSSIAVQNPFRYRSYYYDSESGLYYLQSRYYDPVVGRFISADGQIAGVGSTVNGYNLFVYCFNNPVNASDSEGEWPNWRKLASGIATAVTGMVAVAAVATASTCAAPIIMAATAIAGIASMAFGASEITESFTGENPIRDKVFKGNTKAYEATKFVATSVASIGTGSLAKAVCFIAGTTILSAWSKKNIEDISPGDYVFATDPETGETRLKRVVQTFVNETDELVYVYVNGEEIVTTPEHPFYVSNNGWVGAINLRAGDKLVLVNGEYAVVEKVQHEILEQPITVYNFEVEDFHTYYVGESAVLVHNICQKHHFLSDKNSTYTSQFKEITDKYGLNLNQKWNIESIEGHLGRHTNSYHNFMLDSIRQIDAVANGSTEKFLDLFEGVKSYVKNNSSIMYGK